jgi:hypothetical protein
VLSLATPTSVPALYGFVRDGGARLGHLEDPYFQGSSLVARLDDPDYRAWRIRTLLYNLEDHAFAPGDSPCIAVSYKPGWHTHYDEEAGGPSPEICAVEGSNQWTGPTHVCRRDRPRRVSPGGPFHPTQFAPGAFEQAISAFLVEMIEALEAHGYRSPRVITVERPSYGPGHWAVLSAAARNHPAIAGEMGRVIEPTLSMIGRRPPRPTEAPPATPPTTPPSSPPTGTPPGAEPSEPPTASPAPPPRSPSPRSSWSIGSGGPTPSSTGVYRSSGGGSGGVVEAPGR